MFLGLHKTIVRRSKFPCSHLNNHKSNIRFRFFWVIKYAISVQLYVGILNVHLIFVINICNIKHQLFKVMDENKYIYLLTYFEHLMVRLYLKILLELCVFL